MNDAHKRAHWLRPFGAGCGIKDACLRSLRSLPLAMNEITRGTGALAPQAAPKGRNQRACKVNATTKN
jgi:hypothetical protein